MKKSEKIIAIIPARGGSKRLKNKNIMPLLGKPMIQYTIQSALESGVFDEVLVSTDCQEIARVSRECGATVPFLRDPRLADDHTPVSLATFHALGQMENYTGNRYGVVVQLMANCPCRTAEDIKRAYKQFRDSRKNFQISFFPFGWMNPWWAMRLKAGNKPSPLFPKAYKKRSQDLEKLYCPTGALWIARSAALKREKSFYGKGYSVYVMDWRHAVDIDDEDDFHMAQIILSQTQSGQV